MNIPESHECDTSDALKWKWVLVYVGDTVIFFNKNEGQGAPMNEGPMLLWNTEISVKHKKCFSYRHNRQHLHFLRLRWLETDSYTTDAVK